MQILILFLLLLFKNAINQIEAGKINHEKSFDEIFGQRWDEGAEENICQIDQIMHGEIADQNQNSHQQIDQIFDKSFEVKKEESEEMSINDGDQLEQFPENVGQICDHFSSEIDKKKREIVEKCEKIKEKIKKMGKKYSTKEWNKIERKIAQKLETNQREIYKWKREFGLIENRHSYEEKREILKRFDQLYDKINEKLNEKLDGKKEKCKKIIAKHLGINIHNIYNWKKQLKNGTLEKNQKINDEKGEIVEKYFKIKNEFSQMAKHSRKEWNEFRSNVKQMFGVSYSTIERWAKKFGIKQNVSKAKSFSPIAKLSKF